MKMTSKKKPYDADTSLNPAQTDHFLRNLAKDMIEASVNHMRGLARAEARERLDKMPQGTLEATLISIRWLQKHPPETFRGITFREACTILGFSDHHLRLGIYRQVNKIVGYEKFPTGDTYEKE